MRKGRRHVSALEAVLVLTVIAAIVAMGIWFFLVSRGGIGPGTV